MNKRPCFITLGCVADDFTGASDVASFLTKGGARCLLINGVPKQDFVIKEGYDAVVIALKTRTIAVEAAICDTTKSFDWLLDHGAKTLYFKYCSTFDSTPKGNIGPVLDELLERYNIPYTILCPALPVNKRIVREGILYVDGQPLGESPMKDHPLNPMWNSSVVRLMNDQSKYQSFIVDYHLMEQPDAAVQHVIEELKQKNNHFYISVDYFEEKHGERLAELFADLPLLSGGSALPMHLFQYYAKNKQTSGREYIHDSPGNTSSQRGLILSGSCSVATCNQVQNFIDAGGTAYRIDANRLMNGSQTVEDIWRWVVHNKSNDVLIYSSDDNCHSGKPEDQARISHVLEGAVARLGRLAVEYGIANIIVAGGETSGAVIQSLGSDAFEIGESLAPGVPILFPLDYPKLKIALKSGNFGQPDFFSRALSIMRGVYDK